MKSSKHKTIFTKFLSDQAGSGNYLFLKFLFLISGFVLLSSLVIGLIFWNEQGKVIYEKELKVGRSILTLLSHNATIPLLNDDTLALNSLLKEVTNTAGFLYASIADRNGNVRAHTDPKKIGAVIDTFPNPRIKSGPQEITQNRLTLNGEEVLELSAPIVFRSANLGSIHLGLSIKSLRQQIILNHDASLRAAFPVFVFLLFISFIAAFVISRSVGKRSDSVLTSAKTGDPYYVKKLQKIQNVQHKGAKPLPLDIARHQVTVLFAGVKGFKKYTDSRKPEEALEHLNEYFSIATNHIQTFEGYTDKFVGDAVIAVFGSSPLELDHSERAVRCATAMQTAFKNSDRYQNQLLSLVGIGISSGVVLSGTMGSQDKMQFTFIGESFRSAYFLSVIAGPGEIILSKDVYQLIEDMVKVEPVPPREMIDRSDSWDSFRLKEIVS